MYRFRERFWIGNRTWKRTASQVPWKLGPSYFAPCVLRAAASARGRAMGCGPSTPTVSPAAENTQRPGVPLRVEFPTADGLVAGTVGKALEGENQFEVRVDNDGPVLSVILKRPEALSSFEDFQEEAEGNDADEDDDFAAFVKKLPLKIGQPIDIILEGERVEGRIATVYTYEAGERLFLLSKTGEVVDAVVVGKVNASSRHSVRINGQTATTIDLNDYNHTKQRFETVQEYHQARTTYITELIDKLALIEDAITGNRLNADDQVCRSLTCYWSF